MNRHGVLTLRFKVSARNLKDSDTLGLTDPYCKVYTQTEKDGWNLIGATEIHKNSLEANWSFIFEDKTFVQGANQFWKVEVWDHDQIGRDDLVGITIVHVDTYFKNAERITYPLSTHGTISITRSGVLPK